MEGDGEGKGQGGEEVPTVVEIPPSDPIPDPSLRAVLYNWGRGDRGCLGSGSTRPRLLPTRVEWFKDQSVRLAHVDAAGLRAVALDTRGRVYEWGDLDPVVRVADGNHNPAAGSNDNGNGSGVAKSAAASRARADSVRKTRDELAKSVFPRAVDVGGLTRAQVEHARREERLRALESGAAPDPTASSSSVLSLVSASASASASSVGHNNSDNVSTPLTTVDAADARSVDSGGSSSHRTWEPCCAVACGDGFAVAVTSRGGRVYTWGDGALGTLGRGMLATGHDPVPRRVESLRVPVRKVAAGRGAAAAIAHGTGDLYVWGSLARDFFTPVRIDSFRGVPVRDVACGDRVVAALTEDGRVHTWGRSEHGELGHGVPSLAHAAESPVELVDLRGHAIVSISCGASFMSAVSDVGHLYLWGSPPFLANPVFSPERVQGIPPVTAASCGADHVVLVGPMGCLLTIGSNDAGQLGAGHSDPLERPLDPVFITSLLRSAAVSITAGDGWSAAVVAEDPAEQGAPSAHIVSEFLQRMRADRRTDAAAAEWIDRHDKGDDDDDDDDDDKRLDGDGDDLDDEHDDQQYDMDDFESEDGDGGPVGGGRSRGGKQGAAAGGKDRSSRSRSRSHRGRSGSAASGESLGADAHRNGDGDGDPFDEDIAEYSQQRHGRRSVTFSSRGGEEEREDLGHEHEEQEQGLRGGSRDGDGRKKNRRPGSTPQGEAQAVAMSATRSRSSRGSSRGGDRSVVSSPGTATAKANPATTAKTKTVTSSSTSASASRRVRYRRTGSPITPPPEDLITRRDRSGKRPSREIKPPAGTRPVGPDDPPPHGVVSFSEMYKLNAQMVAVKDRPRVGLLGDPDARHAHTSSSAAAAAATMTGDRRHDHHQGVGDDDQHPHLRLPPIGGGAGTPRTARTPRGTATTPRPKLAGVSSLPWRRGKKTTLDKDSPVFRQALEVEREDRDDVDIKIMCRVTRRIEAFVRLGPFMHAEVMRSMHVDRFGAGQVVFEQGSRSAAWYIILEGSADVEVRLSPMSPETTVVAKLPAGTSFGERGLVQGGLRAATIRTTSPCVMFRVDQDDYIRVMKVSHQKELEDKVALLQSAPVLSHSSTMLLQQLAGIAVLRDYRAGEIVYTQGDDSEALYVVLRGKCSVHMRLEIDVVPREKGRPLPDPADPGYAGVTRFRSTRWVQVDLIERPGYFGEIGLLRNARRCATVRADVDTTLLVLGREDFLYRVHKEMTRELRLRAEKYLAGIDLMQLFREEQELKQWQNYKSTLVADIVEQRKIRRNMLRGGIA